MTDFCLLTVHAHPDDEASKGAGTVARYHAAGVRTVLVCATGGEEGDILNPAMDSADVRERLHDIRMEELRRAASIIGYDEIVMLGYRDSGMPESEANNDPRSFWQADIDEATQRLCEVIHRVKPQVIITYGDDQRGYPHPDHLRVHDISVRAFERTAEPLKLYYYVWSTAREVARHEKFVELGLESPYTEEWFQRPRNDHLVTTRVDITGFTEVTSQALLAHATQVDPTSPFWFGLPAEAAHDVYPFEEYTLARTRVETTAPEDDLFVGISTGR